MIEKKGNYYSGYYELAIEQGKKIDGLMKDMSFDRSLILSSDDEMDSCPYEYANGTIFLKGSCNLFANTLKKKFGYDVFNVECAEGCHWFCKTIYGGKTLYIDARGGTSDFDEFRSWYPYIKDPETPTQRKMDDTDLLFEDEEWRDTGYVYAIHMIDEHRNYYGDFD